MKGEGEGSWGREGSWGGMGRNGGGGVGGEVGRIAGGKTAR